jgi:molybdenum cofactor cytidylyltransferase
MGEPKQLLPLNGRPLLEHTLANLRNVKLNEIVVVLGCDADAVWKRVDLHGIKVVENKNYEKGMGNSLGIGVSALAEATDGALIVLADQPFVRPETYEWLIDQYRQSDAEIVIPTYRGFRGNPVLLDRSVFPEVMALSGDVGCRAIFGDHSSGIAKVAVDDIGIVLDIDTKDDFARLRRYRAGVEGIDTQLDAADLTNRTIAENGAPSHATNNLILVGSEPVVVALAKLARILQFRVTLLDPLLRASDLPEAHEVLNSLDLSRRLQEASNCYMVIASRGRFDEEAIEQAFEADIGYIALVANRKRADEVRTRLRENGHEPKKLARLRSPAGLAIGANTAEEIALSILAEIVSVSRKSAEDSSL